MATSVRFNLQHACVYNSSHRQLAASFGLLPLLNVLSDGVKAGIGGCESESLELVKIDGERVLLLLQHFEGIQLLLQRKLVFVVVHVRVDESVLLDEVVVCLNSVRKHAALAIELAVGY